MRREGCSKEREERLKGKEKWEGLPLVCLLFTYATIRAQFSYAGWCLTAKQHR